MSKKKGHGSGVISGFKYFMSIHMGIGRGPVNEVTDIKASDILAWSGSMTDNGEVEINAPNLFGGDSKEGGLVGKMQFLFGAADQVVPGNIVASLGGLVPGFRGVTTLFYSGEICANNPYPKAMKVRVRRYSKGWEDDDPFYPDRALVIMQGPAVIDTSASGTTSGTPPPDPGAGGGAALSAAAASSAAATGPGESGGGGA